jgi:hypothetical protein
VSVLVAGSWAARHNLLAAQSAALRADNNLQTPPKCTLVGEGIRASLAEDGTIRALEVKSGGEWERVEFRHGTLAGPAWAGVKMQRVEGSACSFAGAVNGVRHFLRYRIEGNRLAIMARLENEGLTDYAPKAARLVLGINSEMVSYPSWDYRYFPTLLRCEKTHFWGYFMTPKGRIMTIGSPDPVASYNMNYEESVWVSGDGGNPMHARGDGERNPDGSTVGGPMIYTCSLDLMHTLPLPPRHPQNLISLRPGAERAWTIYLQPAGSVEEVKPFLASSLSAPMIDADR